MAIAVILSLDYELFGNGSGSVQTEQIRPTAMLLDLLEEYGAKLSLFMEFGQYQAFGRFQAQAEHFAEDNARIREQLRDAVRRGHDVQLHYHPAWHNAICEKTRISLEETRFDLSMLHEDEIEHVLKEGKHFLEKLLQPIRASYECNAFRAGAWSLSDPKKVLPILRRLGFRCDSSVVPGARFRAAYGDFDWSTAPHPYRPWSIADDLTTPVEDGAIHEIPIYTLRHPFAALKYRNPTYFANARAAAKRCPVKACEKGMGLLGKARKILGRNYYMADFNAMSFATLRRMTARAVRECSASERPEPVMFIGHSKTTHCVNDLRRFLDAASRWSDVEFWSLGAYVSRFFPVSSADVRNVHTHQSPRLPFAVSSNTRA